MGKNDEIWGVAHFHPLIKEIQGSICPFSHFFATLFLTSCVRAGLVHPQVVEVQSQNLQVQIFVLKKPWVAGHEEVV